MQIGGADLVTLGADWDKQRDDSETHWNTVLCISAADDYNWTSAVTKTMDRGGKICVYI